MMIDDDFPVGAGRSSQSRFEPRQLSGWIVLVLPKRFRIDENKVKRRRTVGVDGVVPQRRVVPAWLRQSEVDLVLFSAVVGSVVVVSEGYVPHPVDNVRLIVDPSSVVLVFPSS